MVAACRAIETAQPDGLVCDPLAERLAGERGMAIARAQPILEWMCFGVGVRARFMDELLMEAARSGGIETMVNLGAGLDTRPWRLELPPRLRWIEADFEGILEYKAARLAAEKPRCRLEQVPTDLVNAEARQELFERVGPAAALMITEGLLMYLPSAAFMSLASEAPRLAGIRNWLLDVASEDAMRMATAGRQTPIENLRPKDQLVGQAILDAAQASGWTTVEKRTYARDGAAFAATRVQNLLESAKQAGTNFHAADDDVSGIYLFERAKG